MPPPKKDETTTEQTSKDSKEGEESAGKGRAGGAQEGGGGDYHCSTAAGHSKLASTLEIPALEQVGPFCCFLLPVLAHSGQSARWPVLGVQRH